jgi:hypothetical protein
MGASDGLCGDKMHLKLTGTPSSFAALLAATYACGAPGGGVLIVVFWWLLPVVADPTTAGEWWEYAVVAAYIFAPLWAPLASGFVTLRLAAQLGWVDWRSA